MKKILVILAACAFMVSCQFWHETFSSPEDCAVWYCEQMAEAEKDGDAEKVEQLAADFDEWINGLDEADKEEAVAASVAWAMSNSEF